MQGSARYALIEHELMTSAGEEKKAGIERLQYLVEEITKLGDSRDRMHRVLEYASKLGCLPAEAKISANRVMGCTAQVCSTGGLFSTLQIVGIECLQNCCLLTLCMLEIVLSHYGSNFKSMSVRSKMCEGSGMSCKEATCMALWARALPVSHRSQKRRTGVAYGGAHS